MTPFARPSRAAAAALVLGVAGALAPTGPVAADPEPQVVRSERAGALAPTGRAGDTQPLVLRSEVLDRPPLAATVTAQAGEAVLETGRQNTYDGLELSTDLTVGDGVIFRKLTIHPGKLKATQRDRKYIYYFPDRMTENTWPKPATAITDSGLCAEIANPTRFRLFVILGHCVISLKQQPAVRPIQVVDVDPASAYRALIYSGRAGDWVTFIYREASGDPARPPTSQEVRFDLTKGPMVDFKGARFEILDVTAERVTYRLINSFAEGGG